MTIEELLSQFKKQLPNVNTLKELEDLRVDYLGKKGQLSHFFTELKELSGEDKIALGSKINLIKNQINDDIEEKRIQIEEKEYRLKEEKELIDITIPSFPTSAGSLHPINIVIDEIKSFFIELGYAVAEGQEVEEDLYNFEMMNMPKDHPARDMQDTFYIDERFLLRTHTSPVQARTMLKSQGEAIKIICPGKVYRRDEDDATHSHQFSQIEGLVIGSDISMADLKGTLDLLMKHLFGQNRKLRMRSSFFPFTEPSVEIDITCNCDNSSNCPVCKGSGYIEILGAGMVHPNVLKMGGYDPEKYSAFAFGIGVERVAMLKYGFKDIRDFFNNDLRILRLFTKER